MRARGRGAFYLFLKSPEPDARAFCRRAMDYDILLVPGDDFGCPGYARLAYCVARSQLERSLPRHSGSWLRATGSLVTLETESGAPEPSGGAVFAWMVSGVHGVGVHIVIDDLPWCCSCF